MLKQLILLGNKLDESGLTRIADEIDVLVKLCQLSVNKSDLDAAIQFYNDTSLDGEISPENLTLKEIVYMPPEEFLPETDISDKGWLKNLPKEKWGEALTKKHGRNFTHIINMYLSNQMNPAIQINGNFADGIARSIFFNAIGEDMPVANFIS